MSTENTTEKLGELVIDDIPAKDDYASLNKDEVFVHRALGEHESELAKAAASVFRELRELSNLTIRVKREAVDPEGQRTSSIADIPASQTIMQACSMLEHALIAAKRVRKAALELNDNPEAI